MNKKSRSAAVAFSTQPPPFPIDRKPAYPAWVIGILVLAWLLPGLVGHDPWKMDEAINFGVIHSMLERGSWLVPHLAGEPYLDKPPLYFWTTAYSAKIFSVWFADHDAARLSTGLFIGLALVFTALCARELYGRGYGRIAVLILIGSIGLILHAHELIAETALMTALAAALYGISLGKRSWAPAGGLIGLGVGLSFMTAGIAQATMIIFFGGLISLLAPAWRTWLYGRALLLSVIVSLPFLLLWPWYLYQAHPDLFRIWFWQNNMGFVLGLANKDFPSQVYYFLQTLPWFAWPAWPLALWTLWRTRGAWYQPAVALPLSSFVVIFFMSSLLVTMRDVHVLPMLIPLSLLASGAVESLRKGAISALEWFGLMTFGLIAGVLWTGWFALHTGQPERLAAKLARMYPGFSAEFHGLAFAIAVIFTLAWLVMVLKRRRAAELALSRWAMGLILMWALLATIWMPFIDGTKSYRATLESLRAALPPAHDCISSQGLGDPQRALLDYFAGVVTQRAELSGKIECSLVLIQGNSKQQDLNPGPGWRLIWEGHRPGDKYERFKLFQHG